MISIHHFPSLVRTTNYSWSGIHIPVQSQAGLPTYRSLHPPSFPVSQWITNGLSSLNTVTRSCWILTSFPFHPNLYIQTPDTYIYLYIFYHNTKSLKCIIAQTYIIISIFNNIYDTEGQKSTVLQIFSD